MKLLVFAHTPPPHHGQSYMVQLMLDGFGGDCRDPTVRRRRAPQCGAEARSQIECYHVNVRLSKQLEEIGDIRVWKMLLLVWYCLEAIWCRFRYGVTNMYYVPAPGKKSALFRDWLVMALCRPFFKRVVLHWHASGLAKWLETAVQIRSRAITYRYLKQVDLSIVLSAYGRADALKLLPRCTVIVGNGIPDPCPNFRTEILPLRRSRAEARRMILAGQPMPAKLEQAAGADPHVLRVLFLGHCTRDKGLFDALQGMLLVESRLRDSGSPMRLSCTVAGQFIHAAEEQEFQKILAGEGRGLIDYAGFVTGQKKWDLLKHADLFCFPSHLESFGLVLVEAMAAGLPCIAARAGAMPEVMLPKSPGLVDVRSPDQIAEVIINMMTDTSFEQLRARFEDNYSVDRYVENVARALISMEEAEHHQSSPERGVVGPVAAG